MIVGMSAVWASAFRAASTAQPSMPGMTTSRMIAEGCSCLASRSPSSPLLGGPGPIALLVKTATHQFTDRDVIIDDEHEIGLTARGIVRVGRRGGRLHASLGDGVVRMVGHRNDSPSRRAAEDGR